MATAIILGSVLSSGAGAVAGLTTAGTLFGVSAATFASIGAGFGAAATGIGMIQGQNAAESQYQATIMASKSALLASQIKAEEGDLAAQREKTQTAIEESNRQRQLRRVLASQKATFSGAGIDYTSGSPATIQDQTVNEINRESNSATFASQDRVSSINRQNLGILAAGAGQSASLLNDASINKAIAGQKTLMQAGQLLGDVADISKTIKRKKA